MTNFYDILRKDLEEREKNERALKNANILDDFLSEEEIKKPHTAEEIKEAIADDEAFMIFCMRASLS